MEAATTIIHGDSGQVLRTLPSASFDAMVTDPPSSTSFRGHAWDGDRGGRAQWISWLASIFAECARVLKPGSNAVVWAFPRTSHYTAMALEDGGFEIRDVAVHLTGRAYPKHRSLLKPNAEHWVLAKTPGPARPLGIDACRTNGRYPSNVTLEHDAKCGSRCEPTCPVATLDAHSGHLKSGHSNGYEGPVQKSVALGDKRSRIRPETVYADEGGASRFFYCGKASKEERAGNPHPTVKPMDLTRWLCRLVTPPGGRIIDPFAGSGTTVMAARAESMTCTGIEQDAEYVRIAKTRAGQAAP